MSWVRRSRGASRRRTRGAELTDEHREQLTQLAVTAERNRIAREMHDIVAHNLSVMIALTDGAALMLDRDPDRAREAIDHVAATGRSALAEMRNTFALLRSGLDEDGDPALSPEHDLADLDKLLETARSTGLQVTYQISGSTEALPTTMQLALFRLVQEGITNTLKHAPRATRLHVSIRRGQEDLRAVVDDNGGTGSAASTLGHGLIGMRERVALHNGRLFAGPTGSGWRVSAWLPLNDDPGRPGRRRTAPTRRVPHDPRRARRLRGGRRGCERARSDRGRRRSRT
jgi:signal transduction histidine kinase